MDYDVLSGTFERFADVECKGSSSLYEWLSMQISGDKELLDISAHCSAGQPVPNLFLAAVHYLLLSGEGHALQAFYPSVTEVARQPMESFPAFKDFCMLYRDQLIDLVQNRRVQTNEIRRCAYLYPAFGFIYQKTMKPLALVEIGTSAGLQLLWDRYSYSYGTGATYGDLSSQVHVRSELRRGRLPALPHNSPPVASKVGIDIHIADLGRGDDYLWMKSLIWPEHKQRIVLFEEAVEVLKDNPVDLMEGDGVALLPEVARDVPDDSVLCVFHTHVANQMSVETKRELLEHVRALGTDRDVFHLYNNMWDAQLHLDYFVDGMEHNVVIGETDGHGRWFDWNL